MGVARIPARLCAFNPDHGAATTTARMDGRDYPACAGCVCDPVEVKATPLRRGEMGRPNSPLRGPILVALGASPGADFVTLARFCGVPLEGARFATFRRLLCAMVASGDIERTGKHRGPRFYLRGEAASPGGAA